MTIRVLLADDHRLLREGLRRILEGTEGIEVVGEAEDGESALEAAARLHPDVVLLDVQLPGIDGFEVAQRLTANGSRAQVVLVSSRDGSDFGPLVEQSGAAGFIPKAELSGQAVSNLLS